jgi:hypothetical protein
VLNRRPHLWAATERFKHARDECRQVGINSLEQWNPLLRRWGRLSVSRGRRQNRGKNTAGDRTDQSLHESPPSFASGQRPAKQTIWRLM